jgi:hypothetical protein
VNVEQASKRTMREPTRQIHGEGRRCEEEDEKDDNTLTIPPG